MFPSSLNRASSAVVTALVAVGLMLTLGCQSSPETEQQQQPLGEPAAESDETGGADPYENPYDQPDQPDQHEQPDQQPQQQQPPGGQQQQPQAEPPGQQQQQPPGGQQQQPQQGPMAPQQPQEMPDVDDEKVDEFADAIVAASEIDEEEIEGRMDQAESPEEVQQIQQEVLAEMQANVEATGMNFQEFVQLSQQIQMDPELQQDLRDELEERGEEHLLEQPAEGM